MKNFVQILFPNLDTWEEVFRNLRQNKKRALLTAFGIYWGVFMLVVMLGASKGFENGVIGGMDIAKNTVFLWTQSTSKPYKGYQPGRNLSLDYEDAIAIRRQVVEAAFVAPRLVLGRSDLNYKNNMAAFNIYGDEPDFLAVKPIEILEGRFINPNDITQKRKVAIIGKRVQEVLFKSENPIGKKLLIKGVPFMVIGIFRSNAQGEEAIEDAQSVYIPLTTMQTTFQMPNRVGWFALIPTDGISASIVEAKTVDLLKKRHKVHPEDPRAFGTANIEKEFEQINMVFLGFRGFSWLVALGTLFAAIVGVINIMMFVVRERTLEIGIRKAMGATPWDIVAMITKEALLLTGISGYLGLLSGLFLVEGMRKLMVEFQLQGDFFGHPEIDFSVALSSLLLLFISGTIAGLIPGAKAAQIEPVEALRTAN